MNRRTWFCFPSVHVVDSCVYLVCLERLWFWDWCCRPFRAEGERSASIPQSIALLPSTCIQPVLPSSILIFGSKGWPHGYQGPQLYRSVSYFCSPGRGAPLFGCASVRGLFVLLLLGAWPWGLFPGVGRACAVSLPSLGSRWVAVSGSNDVPVASLWLKVSSLFFSTQVELQSRVVTQKN